MAQPFSGTQDHMPDQDWTQWMHWDDNQETELSTMPTTTLENLTIPASELPQSHLSYPVSPTTSNEDILKSSTLSNSQPITHDLLTPSHSSGSPESTHSRHPRLGGETLWDSLLVEDSTPSLKRKFTSQVDPSPQIKDAQSEKRPAKKRPHNIIEKRYRANLNEKIAELRDSVPSLRVAKRAEDAEGDDIDDDELQGLAPSNKLNKASVLTKAVEYIHHLELRTKRLDDENRFLKNRLSKLEKMISQGDNQGAQRATAFTSKNVIEPTTAANAEVEPAAGEESSSKKPVQGLIGLPESMRRLRENMPQEHYGYVFESESRPAGGRKWPARFMLGSLAGLMIIEGFSESNSGTESKSKGLFGIPLELLDGYRFLASHKVYMEAFYKFCQAGGIFPLVKGFFALSAVAFIIFAYLFNSKPPAKLTKTELEKPRRAPSLASPIGVRQQAWLTSSQSLRLPHHSFFAEWMALTMEWLKYMVRVLAGPYLYSVLTGLSGEAERERVKAWDIAIDAQLAGGDPEIRRSRVVLTIFASGLLPKTPARRMIKALHCRVLLWRVGSENSRFAKFWNRVGLIAANNEWKMARQIQENLPAGHPDALPNHLAFLLQQPCHEVMNDSIIQRAYNLMFGRPSSERTSPEDVLMDVVVEDHAIRGPLDALSAWWSSQALRQALFTSPSISDEPPKEFYRHLESAIKAAPPVSAAHTRSTVMKAIFLPTSRSQSIETVKAALRSPEIPISPNSLPFFIDSSTPFSARSEILIALRCAEILAAVEQDSPQPDEVERAVTTFAGLCSKQSDMTLLSFASASTVLKAFVEDEATSSPTLYPSIVHCLCSWISEGGSQADHVGSKIRSFVDRQCSAICEECPERRKSRLSLDSGYGSSDERDMDFSDV